MLSRLQNTFASGLNKAKNGLLPKYVVVVLDDDLVTYLDFQHDGAATLLGTWVQWLVQQFNELIEARAKQLPNRCGHVNMLPYFYWVSAPTHSLFSKDRNNLRMKFNLSLDSVIRSQDNMRVIRLKDYWNTSDTTLVVNDRMTENGLSAYWDAIDATFRFNEKKREVYRAKLLWQKEKPDIPAHISPSDQMLPKQKQRGDASYSNDREDPMFSFFNKHRRLDTDGRFYQNAEFRMGTREDFVPRHGRFQDNMVIITDSCCQD